MEGTCIETKEGSLTCSLLNQALDALPEQKVPHVICRKDCGPEHCEFAGVDQTNVKKQQWIEAAAWRTDQYREITSL